MTRKRRLRQQRAQFRRLQASHDKKIEQDSETFDRRRPERPPPARILTIKGNSELFERLVNFDFEYLCSLPFAAEAGTLRLLLPQSVCGRAQNGHGCFCDADGTPLQFPEAGFDRILSVLERRDPDLRNDRVRQQRGRLLESLRDFLLGHLDVVCDSAKDANLELQIDGVPLLGVGFLAERPVDARAFFRGLVLAGFMDDIRQREMTLSYRPLAFDGSALTMGGGRAYVVATERYERIGILDAGQVVFDDREIAHLRNLGVIQPDDTQVRYSFPSCDQVFFRRRLGEGVSDDLALIYIGQRLGLAGLLGAFVMDAVDTYDKHLWHFGCRGFDTLLAEEIQGRCREITGRGLVSGEEILDLIHFAAKANTPPCRLSSSHRRFIQFERGAKVPTLQNHWLFLQGEALYDIDLGYSRFPAREFYDIARQRLQLAGRKVAPPRFVQQKQS